MSPRNPPDAAAVIAQRIAAQRDSGKSAQECAREILADLNTYGYAVERRPR